MHTFEFLPRAYVPGRALLVVFFTLVGSAIEGATLAGHLAPLIFRSAFFSRIIDVLLGIGGLCYLANSFTDFLAPAFAQIVTHCCACVR